MSLEDLINGTLSNKINKNWGKRAINLINKAISPFNRTRPFSTPKIEDVQGGNGIDEGARIHSWGDEPDS